MVRTRVGNKLWCLSCKRKHDLGQPRGSRDPEALIKEYGATELSKTSEGRMVLRRAGQRYKAELVQPGDPEFNKLYAKQNKEIAERRRANEERSRKEWADRGLERGQTINNPRNES